MDLKRYINRFDRQSYELDPLVFHLAPQDDPNLNVSLHLKNRISQECRGVQKVCLRILLPQAQDFLKLSRIVISIESYLLIHLPRGRFLHSWIQIPPMVLMTF